MDRSLTRAGLLNTSGSAISRFLLDEGNRPRNRQLKKMDKLSAVRRRAYQIETPDGTRIDMQEEYRWYGEEA